MKITFIEAVQSYGGAQIATVDLAWRLSQAGHDISMIDCYGSCVPFVMAVREKGLELTIIDQRKEPFVIHKYNSRLRNAFRLFRYIPHWLSLRRKIALAITKISPDRIICYNHKVLSLLNKSSHYKIIYYAHGWYLPSQIGRSMRHMLLTRVDNLIAISHATRMALYAGGIAPLDRISVVHNAIDINLLPTQRADIPDSDRYFKVLVSGGFLPDKGLYIAIETARTLKQRNFPIKLIITGIVYKGEDSLKYYDYIVDLVSRYGLNDEVIIVRDRSNVIDYFRACDCLIHPSSTEGLPLVVMEAMALGKPTIVNAVGGVTDMVIDGFTGIIAPFNDVSFYADAIERIANDNQFRRFLVDNALSLTKHSLNKETQISDFERAIQIK